MDSITNTTPRTLFQQKLSNILKKESDISPFFEIIFKLQQLSLFQRPEKVSYSKISNEENWKILLNLLNELGPQEFIKLISIIKGKTIIFPTEEELKDSILTTLCYYYKEIEGKTWEDIKKLVNMENLNTIKFGIKVRQLQQFIQTQILQGLIPYEK